MNEKFNESHVIFNDNQLSYIGQNCGSIPTKLLEDYGESVTRLDISFNQIRSLDGLGKLSKLEELILDNNCLTDDIEFPRLPNLHTLMLNKNKIKDLEKLLEQINKCFPKLKYLSLLGNEACPNQLSCLEKDEDDYRRYRLYVLYKCPQLKFLDSTPVKDTEKHEAYRQGQYLRVVKPDFTSDNVSDKRHEKTSPYNPLPDDIRMEPDHRATFGRSRYVYYGKHSEGNRFIRNNDL